MKSANDFLNIHHIKPTDLWFLKSLVKSPNLKYLTCFSNALQYVFSFLSICPNQNHPSNPDYSPTFSTNFYKLPKPDYCNLFQLEILIDFTANKTELSTLLGLSLIASCLTLIVSYLFMFFFCNL